MQIDAMDAAALARTEAALDHHYAALRAEGLNLDLTRGKPAGDQLDLSAALDGALDGGYRTEDGTDTRGYGGSDGIAEARRLGAEWLGLAPEEVLASGNSSLTLMYLFLLGTHRFGLPGARGRSMPAAHVFSARCPATTGTSRSARISASRWSRCR